MNFGDLEQLQASFRQEATDLLADLGDALLLLEQDPSDNGTVNRVFRAMHTLKGSGASAGYKRLAQFVHSVEEVFNLIRSRQLECTPELIDATLKACDCCAILMSLSGEDFATPLPLEAEVLAAMRPFLPEAKSNTGRAESVATEGLSSYEITFNPNPQIFFSGTDPASLLLELADLGRTQIQCHTNNLFYCESTEFDPEQCYLRWTVQLETEQTIDAVRAVFQFIEDDCDLSINLRTTPAAAHQKTVTDPAQDRFQSAAQQCLEALRFGLEECRSGNSRQGLTTAHRAALTLISITKSHGHTATTSAAQAILDKVLSAQGLDSVSSSGLHGIQLAVDQFTHLLQAPVEVVEIAPNVVSIAGRSTAAPVAPPESAQSIRVDSAKLDALMRLAGELLVSRGAIPSFADRLERGESPESMIAEMRDAAAKFSRLADDLQLNVMSMRMLPVKHVFQRFARLIRDITRALDKNIDLQITGENTELDKTVIEALGDPLTHIIRNAADHGIESKEERAAAGKRPMGHIHLSAYTRGGNVMIEVRDDGKGLDAAKLKRRALEKGLYTQAVLDAMNQSAAFKIILAAGFSTVDNVTDLSGRGVGMDVVRNSVEALGGSLTIESELGKGTCFRIELPASMLVSRGILVEVARQRVVLPMENILRLIKLPALALQCVQGQQLAHFRGAVYPILSLARILAYPPQIPRGSELAVAIVESSSGSYGLIVDAFLGEVEVVAKPLEGLLASVQEYLGAAIMSDGKTVLVINTEKLLMIELPDAQQGVSKPAN